MASVTGKVPFAVGERQLTLHFTTNRLCALEDQTKLSTMEVATELALGKSEPLAVSKRTLRAMLWAGIGGDTTLAQAGDLLDAIGHRRAVGLVIDAFDAAHPDIVDEQEDAKEGADRPLDAAAG